MNFFKQFFHPRQKISKKIHVCVITKKTTRPLLIIDEDKFENERWIVFCDIPWCKNKIEIENPRGDPIKYYLEKNWKAYRKVRPHASETSEHCFSLFDITEEWKDNSKKTLVFCPQHSNCIDEDQIIEENVECYQYDEKREKRYD